MSLSGRKTRLQGFTGYDLLIEGQDLRSMDAFGSVWRGTSFVDCQMNLANFTNATFEECAFTRCTLDLSSFHSAKKIDAIFSGCSLEQANFFGSILNHAAFSDCRMAYSVFAKVTAHSAEFRDCNLHGADLTFMEMDGKGAVEYDHCNLWNAKVVLGCPFFNAEFDKRSVQQFVAMAARVFPGPEKVVLESFAGDQMSVVRRLMRSRGGLA